MKKERRYRRESRNSPAKENSDDERNMTWRVSDSESVPFSYKKSSIASSSFVTD